MVIEFEGYEPDAEPGLLHVMQEVLAESIAEEAAPEGWDQLDLRELTEEEIAALDAEWERVREELGY